MLPLNLRPAKALQPSHPQRGYSSMWVFIITDFTHPRAPPHKRVNAFRRFQRIDFLIRKFVSTSYILTMRIRHPAYRQRRLFTDRFRAFRLRLLSADFTELLTKGILRSLLPIGVLVWVLWVVLPAFHPSDCQFKKAGRPFCPIFSIRNMSHDYRYRNPQAG